MATRYLTTAIPFVNAAPHIGFAAELIWSDVLARNARRRGDQVRFLTGTDENSLKNVRAAEERGLPTAVLVEENAALFEQLARRLVISNDDFIRTSTDPRHAPGVKALWQACAERGDLYQARYRGLYCVGCEAFLAAADLIGGRCAEHGVEPESVEELNWFFRLSRYADRLEAWIESGQLRIEPEKHRRDALALIRAGLQDFSVSRSIERARGWGIAVPGGQVAYVWFDALANYVTALGLGSAETALFDRWWRDSDRRTHVLGKGITRFHAIYWPAILCSAGLPLPTELLVHDYLTSGGKKIGKSLGNAIDPNAWIDRHGSEAVRYYLLRHTRTGEDSDVSEDALLRAKRTELAGQLGNLLSRTVGLIQKRSGGRIPGRGNVEQLEIAILDRCAALPGRVDAAVEAFRPHHGLEEIFELVAATNRYLAARSPWSRTADRSTADGCLATATEALRVLAEVLLPFLPATAAGIEAQIGSGRAGVEIRSGPVLFSL